MQPNLGTTATKIDLSHSPKTYHIPAWATMNDIQKLKVIRRIISQYGRHPAVVKTTMGILKRAKIKPRDYRGQAATILKWVQNNIYYVNEIGERLQAPEYTIRHGYGDCDDMIILVLSMYEAIRLPNKLVISGRNRQGKMIRYIEGQKRLPNAQWAHIYGMVGNRPYTPSSWDFVEPTLKKPLGWDVVGAGGGGLPELSYGNIGASVATSASQEALEGKKSFMHYLRDISVAVIIGATTAVMTQIVLDRVRVAKWYKKHVIKKKVNRR